MCDSAKDESPTASPKVITPAVDTGVPQYPTAYNGDTAETIQLTPSVTESSPTPYVEPALPGGYSESDNNTTRDSVSSALHLLRI